MVNTVPKWGRTYSLYKKYYILNLKIYLNNIEESKTVFLGYANLKYNEIEEAIKLLKEAWNL